MSVFPRRAALFLLLVAALGLAAVGCGGGGDDSAKTEPGSSEPTVSTDVPPDAIALVGGEKILKSEFDALVAQAKKSYESQQQEFPAAGTPEYEALKNQAVQYLVSRAEFAQEAKALGVAVTDEDVVKRLEELKQQYFGGDQAQFETQLEEQGLTLEQVKADVRAQIVSEKLFEAVTKDLDVTNEEIRTYYDENADLFKQLETRDVRHILVKKKDKADELYEELKNGADFAELAKKFSQDPGSKDEGGKYEGVQKGQFVPEFDGFLFDPSSKTGVVSEPIKTEFGWHIIEPLSEIKPPAVTPFEEVETSIRDQLVQQKKNEAMAAWVSELETKYADKVVYAVGFAPPATPELPAETAAGETAAAATE